MIDSTERAAAGAEVRLRPVEELAPEMAISRNQAWGRHRSEVSDEPAASLDDLEWAVVAVAQGRRLARVAQVIGAAREHGLLDVRPGRPAVVSGSER